MTSTGGIRCMMMRGGTSKGLYFLAADLPPQPEQRDALLLRIMGSGHPLQIDGLGGAHSLAAKVAVVSPAQRGDGVPDYTGDTAIAGVPGTAAPISLRFAGPAGSATGQLLPTGSSCDIMPGAAGAELADWPGPGQPLDVEHPAGHLLVEAELDTSRHPPLVRTAGVVRTARKLFDGTVFPSSPA